MTVLQAIREEIGDTSVTPKYSDDRLIRYMNMAGSAIGKVTGTTLTFTDQSDELSISVAELEAVIVFIQYKICMDGVQDNAKGIRYNEGVYEVDKKGVGKAQAETCKLILNDFNNLLTTINPTGGLKSLIQGSVFVQNH